MSQQLFANRSPFYNLLRTYYGLHGFPLEMDVFTLKLSGKNPLVGGDELLLSLTEWSPNSVVDQKKTGVKFSKLHRSGNWVVADLGVPCLVTDLEINFQTPQNTMAGHLTVESHLETGQSPLLLASQKIKSVKKKNSDQRPSIFLQELSRLCRYLRIDVKSFTQINESGTISVKAFGIQDFVSPQNFSEGLLLCSSIFLKKNL